MAFLSKSKKLFVCQCSNDFFSGLSVFKFFQEEEAGAFVLTSIESGPLVTMMILGSTGAAYTYGTSNAAAIADAGIRKAIQLLDDDDVPMDGRVLVVPPVARNSMLGIARFTEQAFRGDGNTLKNGQFGDIYGVKVYVSTNCDTAAGNSTTDRVALMFHKDWAVLAEQMGVRSQTQYKQEYLGTLFTSDMLYGVKELRDEACVPIVVTA